MEPRKKRGILFSKNKVTANSTLRGAIDPMSNVRGNLDEFRRGCGRRTSWRSLIYYMEGQFLEKYVQSLERNH